MRIPKLSFLLLCFILIINTLSAQTNLSEGYYVGIAKDTVRGFFNFDNLAYKKILFYTDKTASSSKKLAPEDIQEIETLDKNSIRTFNYTGGEQAELIFITRYVDGSVSLYEGQSSNPDEQKLYCISSTKIPLIRKISAANTKSYLNTYFKGCELGSNFSVKYDKLSVLAAVTEYSKCAYPNAKIVQKTGKSSKISVEIGVQTGAFMNKGAYRAFFRSYIEKDVGSKIAPLFGAVVVFGISNRIKIYTGANYFQRQFIPAPTEYVGPPALGVLFFRLKANYIELPLAVHYEFKKKNPAFIPKIFIGASKLIATKAEVDYDPLEPLYQNRSRTSDFSFFGGIGVKKMFKNKSSIELNIKVASEIEAPTYRFNVYSDRYEMSLTYLLSLYDK